MKKVFVVIAAVTLIGIVSLLTYFLILKEPAADPNKLEIEENAQVGIMPGVDLEERRQQLQEELDNSMIAFSVNTNPVFNNGSAEGNLMIENPEHNAKLLVAEIRLNGTNELIYTSKAILPGSYIEKAKLNKSLEKGSYEAMVQFLAYSEDSNEFIGQTAAGIHITIAN